MKNEEVGAGAVERKSEGRMKKLSSFRAVDDRYKNGYQLAAFLHRWIKVFRSHNFGVGEQLHPVRTLFKFSQRITTFGDKLCLAPSSMSLAIVRSGACAGAQ